MKFEDYSQNVRMRLRMVQALVLLLLAVLAVRLYVLQIINGRQLVDSRPIYSVILSREDTKGKDLNQLIKPLTEALVIDGDILRERFDQIKSQPAFESITIK